MSGKTEQTESLALELIAVFQRCINYPRDEYGVIAMARGLLKASVDTGIPCSRIVDACMELNSRYCPTDGEFLAIANNIAQPDRIAEEERKDSEWHREMEQAYGAPRPFVCDWNLPQAKAKRDREAQMYREIRQHLGTHMGKFTDGRRVTWRIMADAARKLGYTDYADAWESSQVNGKVARGWNEALR